MSTSREDVDTVWVMDALDWDDSPKDAKDWVLERLLFYIDTNASNPVTGVYNGTTLLMGKPGRSTEFWTAVVERTPESRGVRPWQRAVLTEETCQILRHATEYAEAPSMWDDLPQWGKANVDASRFSKVAALKGVISFETGAPADHRSAVRYMSKKRPSG